MRQPTHWSSTPPPGRLADAPLRPATSGEYHALAAYAEVYRPIGAEHQLAMAFPGGWADGMPRGVCLAVNRSGSDFSDGDVAGPPCCAPGSVGP